jgi:hypothetical protein
MGLAIALWGLGSTAMDFVSNNSWGTAEIAIRSNPCPGFKTCEATGLFLQPGLLVCCHQGCLTFQGYLGAVASDSSPPEELGVEVQIVFYFSSCYLSVLPCFLAVLSSLSWFLMLFLFRIQSVLCYPDSLHSWSDTEETSKQFCPGTPL